MNAARLDTWPVAGGDIGAPRLSFLRMISTLVTAALLWSGASRGYYALVEALALDSGYDEAPALFTAYYLGWTTVALAAFRRVWSSHLSRPLIAAHAVALSPVLVAFGVFVAIVLPLLPDVSVYRAPANPPAFMFALEWYYLPKSADILFQQLIVATIVRRAADLGLGLRRICIAVAVLFGGFHLTLALNGFSLLYVTRFNVAASLFGLIVPYLSLRTRHGFRWA